MQSRISRGALAVCATAAVLSALPAAAAAQGTPRERYIEQVSVPRIVEHMAAFQRIADTNGGTREASGPGYRKSVDYVTGKLRAAGYRPTVQRFPFNYFEELSPSVFERVSPSARTYVDQTDYDVMTFSGPGDVAGEIQAVDLVLPPGAAANTSTSGCEDADFAGFVPGRVALIQRGTCGFVDKLRNAQEAGAVGIIVFNEGTPSDPSRIGLNFGTLGTPQTLPAVTTTFAVGEELANLAASGPVSVRLAVDAISEVRTSYNVFADSTLGNPDRDKTIVVGAHLDSVPEGPGINDNGSGSAMILELARQLHRIGKAPENRVRFAWWGAEESGLNGSNFYVANLRERYLSQIRAVLNFDMVASPNGTLGVYDGDLSDTTSTLPAPPGSDEIEQAFLDAFGDQPTVPSDFSGRSDYRAFMLAGIPAGGLFTGAEVPKTAAEAAIFGGVAGEQLDPCYHQACDTLEHVLTENGGLGLELLDANSNAAAAVLYDLAQADQLPGAAAPRRTLTRRTARAWGGMDYLGNHQVR